MKLKVLFAVLNWGLGHATRSESIIDALLRRGLDLSIASSGLALAYLKLKFPSLDFLDLPDKEVNYSRGGAQVGLLKRALIQRSLNKNQEKWTRELLKSNDFDLIVSDNVYGIYHPEIRSVLITHQLKPQVPVMSGAVESEIAKWINCFDEVWIPDIGENGIAGEMLNNSRVSIPKRYLGNISRFEKGFDSSEIDYLAIISGPEPQARIFHDLVLQKFKSRPGKKLIAYSGAKPADTGEVKYLVLGPNQDLNKWILKSRQIICRSGFTSLLDIIMLSANALVVPTPGQPEQEYLAERMKKLGLMRAMSQKKFMASELEIFTGHDIDTRWSVSYLENTLNEFLNSKKPFAG